MLLFDRLVELLRHRSRFTKTTVLERETVKMLGGTNGCSRTYAAVLGMFDDHLLDGELFRTMRNGGYTLSIECHTSRRRRSDPTATTTMHGRHVTVHIRRPRGEPPRRPHVGGLVCPDRQTCLARLLQHEFVHVVEMVIRHRLDFKDGFDTSDRRNVVFLRWLRTIFGHTTDANVV